MEARLPLQIVRDMTDAEKDRLEAIYKAFPGLSWKLVDDGGKTYMMSKGNLAVAFALDGSDDDFIFEA